MNDIKLKLCKACNESKPLSDFYASRGKCKKCFNKQSAAYDRAYKYEYRKLGIEKEKYDTIRLEFLKEVKSFTDYYLSKKYGISANAIRTWKSKGLIDEWRRQYQVEIPTA